MKKFISFLGLFLIIILVLNLTFLEYKYKEKNAKIINKVTVADNKTNNDITCRWIIFNNNQFILTNTQRIQISSIRRYINDNETVLISGYTDMFGNHYYNTHLSQLRANAVRDYLIELGVNPHNIWTRGYGPSTGRAVSICW